MPTPAFLHSLDSNGRSGAVRGARLRPSRCSAVRRMGARRALPVMEAEMSQSSSGVPAWQLEGNAPLAYDTHIVDVFLQDYSRRLVEAAAIKPSDRVLDVACGTGVMTRLLANKIGSAGLVVGFDLTRACSREHALLVKQPPQSNGGWATLQTCRLLMRLSIVSFANMACNSFLTKPQRFPKCIECWLIEAGWLSASGVQSSIARGKRRSLMLLSVI
ncbi:hypothetical protein ABIC01_008332 [Bradyrhizobium sp. RT4b]